MRPAHPRSPARVGPRRDRYLDHPARPKTSCPTHDRGHDRRHPGRRDHQPHPGRQRRETRHRVRVGQPTPHAGPPRACVHLSGAQGCALGVCLCQPGCGPAPPDENQRGGPGRGWRGSRCNLRSPQRRAGVGPAWWRSRLPRRTCHHSPVVCRAGTALAGQGNRLRDFAVGGTRLGRRRRGRHRCVGRGRHLVDRHRSPARARCPGDARPRVARMGHSHRSLRGLAGVVGAAR